MQLYSKDKHEQFHAWKFLHAHHACVRLWQKIQLLQDDNRLSEHFRLVRMQADIGIESFLRPWERTMFRNRLRREGGMDTPTPEYMVMWFDGAMMRVGFLSWVEQEKLTEAGIFQQYCEEIRVPLGHFSKTETALKHLEAWGAVKSG